MKMSEALLGIAIVVLAVIVAHPIAAGLRKANFPINP